MCLLGAAAACYFDCRPGSSFFRCPFFFFLIPLNLLTLTITTEFDFLSFFLFFREHFECVHSPFISSRVAFKRFTSFSDNVGAASERASFLFD